MPRRNSRSSVIGLSRKHQSELVSGLRELRHSIDKVNAANLQCKPTLESLNQMHAKIVASDGCKTVSTSQVCKLRQLTEQAVEESEVEIEALKATLAEINRIKLLRGDKRHYLMPSSNTRTSEVHELAITSTAGGNGGGCGEGVGSPSSHHNSASSSSSNSGSNCVLEPLSILSPRRTLRRGALMTLLRETALALPLFTGSPDEELPPLCGAVPADSSYIIPIGHYVAAKVKTSDEDIVLSPSPNSKSRNSSPSPRHTTGDHSGTSSLVGSMCSAVKLEESQISGENWILAECAGWNNLGNYKYEVLDIDEDNKDCARHILGKRGVVSLPLMKADPLVHPKAVHQKGTRVMALYPQTTCFYSAVVHETPQHSTDEYRVLFEDSSYRDGYSPPLCVPVKFVVSVKEQSSSRKK
ncbi:uncharacterized protein LOC142352249 [Convolutriloba macropyga]|uniref:uncharacterized protein LOC142352249 n=1 Tax=Convolutriloba macropyga TaxID=536237 RepID=UPI003F51CB9A